MGRINSIQAQTHNRYLNLYELDARQRDGEAITYYVASRAKDASQLKAATGRNLPDGVILYGVWGEHRDRIVLVRQFRYSLNDYIYEFPAGLIETGEDLYAAGIREMFEETGLTLHPVKAGANTRPFFTSIGMTDESCGTVFGYCEGIPTNRNQEASEDIEIVLADRTECKRILREENVAIMCAYMLMHFISCDGDPLKFLNGS